MANIAHPLKAQALPEAQVLGELLVMQSVVISLPDERSIFSFVTQGLRDVPGVADVQHTKTPLRVVDASIVSFPILIGESSWGFLLLTISNQENFAPYVDYLKNFTFMLAVILEEREQRRQKELYQAQLEERIRARTRQLQEQVDQQQLIERRLQSAKDYSETLIQTANVLVVGLDLQGRVIVFNHAAEQITGYSAEEMKNRNWLETITPRDRYPEVWAEFNRLKTGGLPRNFENSIVTKTGQERCILWQNSHIRDQTGIIGSISFGIDITERKEAEEQLRRNNALLSVIFDQSFQLMGVMKPDGTLLKVNATAYSLIRGKESEVFDRPFWETPWWRHSPEQQERLHTAVKAAAKGELVRFEATHITPEGKPIFVDFSIKPVMDQNGAVLFLIPEGRDITERKLAEVALLTAKEAAESALSIKSRFLDIAAHELRTPVTVFSALLQLTQKQLEKGHPADLTTIKRLRGQADRLTGLVVDLLDITRLERGRLVLHPVRTDLVSLISDCLAGFRIQVPKRRLTFVPPKEAIEIAVDPTRIEQVLSNLIENALKYSPDDSPIEITLKTMPDRLRVSVTDQGGGIPLAQQAELFKPFYRGSSEREERTSGLGLGLSICRGIIELHGGTIGVESREGSGSSFYFELPRKAEGREKNGFGGGRR